MGLYLCETRLNHTSVESSKSMSFVQRVDLITVFQNDLIDLMSLYIYTSIIKFASKDIYQLKEEGKKCFI